MARPAVCRQSPEVGAGWFSDHVRICAGGTQQCAFLPKLGGGARQRPLLPGHTRGKRSFRPWNRPARGTDGGERSPISWNSGRPLPSTIPISTASPSVTTRIRIRSCRGADRAAARFDPQCDGSLRVAARPARPSDRPARHYRILTPPACGVWIRSAGQWRKPDQKSCVTASRKSSIRAGQMDKTLLNQRTECSLPRTGCPRPGKAPHASSV